MDTIIHTYTPEDGYTIDLENSNLSKGVIVTKKVKEISYKYEDSECLDSYHCAQGIAEAIGLSNLYYL